MPETQHKLLSLLVVLSCEEVGIICQRLEGKRNKSIDLIPQVLIPIPIPILTLVPVFRRTGAAQPLSPNKKKPEARDRNTYLSSFLGPDVVSWNIVVSHGLTLSVADRICSPSSPLPPPGSEASLGNSLNTSEEELHTAGITLAPKGSARTADLHPDSPDRYPLLF